MRKLFQSEIFVFRLGLVANKYQKNIIWLIKELDSWFFY